MRNPLSRPARPQGSSSRRQILFRKAVLRRLFLVRGVKPPLLQRLLGLIRVLPGRDGVGQLLDPAPQLPCVVVHLHSFTSAVQCPQPCIVSQFCQGRAPSADCGPRSVGPTPCYRLQLATRHRRLIRFARGSACRGPSAVPLEAFPAMQAVACPPSLPADPGPKRPVHVVGAATRFPSVRIRSSELCR